MLLRFIKNWTLPLAMIVGTVAYFFFAKIPFVAPLKPCVNGIVAVLTPFLIFAQLLLTFCKVEVCDLKPKTWHGWLLLFQTCACLALAASYTNALSSNSSGCLSAIFKAFSATERLCVSKMCFSSLFS